MTTEVVVVGAGPTGLMLACELGLTGTRPLVIDRLPAPSDTPKANGLVGNIVEVLEARGVIAPDRTGARFHGRPPAFPFGGLSLKLERLADNPLTILTIPQAELEEILSARAAALGVEVLRGRELIALRQDEDGITLTLRGPDGEERLRTRYLAGCDGARSTVRKLADIPFVGFTGKGVARIGHVALAPSVVTESGELDLPILGRLRPGWHRTERGAFQFVSFQPGIHVVAVVEDAHAPVDLDVPMTLEELEASVRRVLGVDLPIASARWVSRTLGNSRQADRYRDGRVFLAGDAAHVFAAGGAALNAGMLDAMNLGWKLSAHLRGWAPAGLLDTYHRERHAAGQRALTHTRVQAALMEPGETADALRAFFTDLLEDPAALRRVAHALQGTDVRHEMEAGADPWLGGWAPDLEIAIDGEVRRAPSLLSAGRAVLLDLTRDRAPAHAARGWEDRVNVICAEPRGAAEARPAILLRPDGHVAWTSRDGGDAGCKDALRRWFGEPSA